ncbi:MAG: hypothetical protein WAQ98_23695 [Blastocatellia bacterium]
MATKTNKTTKIEANKTGHSLIDQDWTNPILVKDKVDDLCHADTFDVDEDCGCDKTETDNNVLNSLNATKPRRNFRILASNLLEKIFDPTFIVLPIVCVTFIAFLTDVVTEIAIYETSKTVAQEKVENNNAQTGEVIESENSITATSESIIESANESTEVEGISYQQDLSLTKPEENPYATFAVDGVTVIESDEPIIKVVNGNKSLTIEESAFPAKKLYVVGKESLDSGNLILVTKSHTFNLYYEIREDATPGNFNVLVKIKK